MISRKLTLVCLFLIYCFSISYAQSGADKILGIWLASSNDIKVQVYKNKGKFEAKVVWFACDAGFVMTDFYDKKNPNPDLRKRSWLGLHILEGLEFKDKNEWHRGKIYDPNSGHTFDSVCYLEDDNTLKVRGYWLYTWIGKSMIFHRVKEKMSN